MHVRVTAVLVATAAAAAVTLSPALASSPQLSAVVSQTAVGWTPNVSATAAVGQAGSPYCNNTYFGKPWPCQSEVYGTAYVNGEVVVVGAFTHACQPGKLSQGLCAPGTQVVRNDIFAYQAGTGLIDPNFAPVLDKGPAWAVIAGPAGSHTVYVGGAFSTVNGAAHSGLVQLNVNPGVKSGATADGSVVTGFNPQVTGGYVRTMALSPDGKALYAGGSFGSVDHVGETGLVRVSAATGAVDKSFQFTLSDPPSGLNTRVDAMDLSAGGGLLAIGGTYRQVNGQSRPRLALISTGGTLGATAKLTAFAAPILTNNCSLQHDYLRGLSMAPSGSFLLIADTGLFGDGVTPGPNVCDTAARFDISTASTATAGTVNVSPSWINYAGGDSFYSVAIAGGVAYFGGHNRWVNDYCGNNWGCEENALLVNGLSALDVKTGLGIPWWHPETLRGAGTFYLNTFPANTYDGGRGGLVIGTDVDVIAGDYHSENALFPLGAATTGGPFGPIPSGIFVEEGGADMNKAHHPMCVGGGTAGTAVTLALCLYNAAENWTVPAAGTAGRITQSGLCLDTKGTQVVLNTCSTAATQQWSQGPGNTVVQQGSGQCLNDPGSAVSAGTALTIAGCKTGDAAQVWPLPAAPPPPAGPPTGFIWSEKIQKDFQEICLDDSGNSTATGNKVVIWTCRGDVNQEWTLEPDGTIRHEGTFCLDSSGGQAVLNPCNGSSSQIWTPLMAKNNELVQKSSGLCLTITGDNTVDGTQPDLEKCQGLSYQTWRMPAV
jgi:hypothetical protein